MEFNFQFYFTCDSSSRIASTETTPAVTTFNIKIHRNKAGKSFLTIHLIIVSLLRLFLLFFLLVCYYTILDLFFGYFFTSRWLQCIFCYNFFFALQLRCFFLFHFITSLVRFALTFSCLNFLFSFTFCSILAASVVPNGPRIRIYELFLYPCKN